MSNRPKGFKRMPIFRTTGFNHSSGKVIIKSFDERLPNDEHYHRLVKHAKNIAKLYSRFNPKHIGSKSIRKILNIIKN